MGFFDIAWKNTYGSTMTLTSDGPALYGEYVSSTGASGTYTVLGVGATTAPTAGGNGVGVTFALLWRPEAGTPNASWHWVSGWGGQGVVDANGNASLSMNHAMVATCPYAVDPPWPATPPGVYLDKIPFVPASATTSGAPPAVKARNPHKGERKKGVRFGDPVEGLWSCASASAELFLQVLNPEMGVVWGEIQFGGQSSPIVGYADLWAGGDSIPLEGITFVADMGQGGPFLSLSGWLDSASGTMTLFQMTSNGTPAGAGYVQTSAQQLTFVRAP